MSQKPENFRSPYLSHRDRIPFALKRILMPDTDFTFVYSGHLEYSIDDGEPFSVGAGEALFVPRGHTRERFAGTERAVYTSIILPGDTPLPVELPFLIRNADSYDIKYCIDRLTELYVSPVPFANELADTLFQYLIYSLASANEKNRKNRYVDNMQRYICASFSEKICLEEVAKSAHISKSYASYIFRKETGLSINSYILDIRMQHATQLLRYTNKSIADIAAKTGFPDNYYFSRAFKRKMSVSPSEYREQYRKEGNEHRIGVPV